MAKKYLKGFSNFGYRPVTKNDEDGYTVDDDKYVTVPGGVSCSPNDNREEFNIPADDGIWDSGSDWESTDLEIVVTETELKTIAELLGATYDSDNEEIIEGTFDVPPEVALSFAALRRDGGYRLYRYFSTTCTGYSVSHTTKGQNNDAQSYTLKFKCIGRKKDGKIRETKDIAKGESLTWIKSFAVQSGT